MPMCSEGGFLKSPDKDVLPATPNILDDFLSPKRGGGLDNSAILAACMLKFMIWKEVSERKPGSAVVKMVAEIGIRDLDQVAAQQRAHFIRYADVLGAKNKFLVVAVASPQRWLSRERPDFYEPNSADEARVFVEVAKYLIDNTGFGLEIRRVLPDLPSLRLTAPAAHEAMGGMTSVVRLRSPLIDQAKDSGHAGVFMSVFGYAT